jgi:hypothetical protein
MELPSFNLSPVAPVEDDLSDPAKSIKLISETFSLVFLPVAASLKIYLKLIKVIVCALDEVAFILVDPMVLLLTPLSV